MPTVTVAAPLTGLTRDGAREGERRGVRPPVKLASTCTFDRRAAAAPLTACLPGGLLLGVAGLLLGRAALGRGRLPGAGLGGLGGAALLGGGLGGLLLGAKSESLGGGLHHLLVDGMSGILEGVTDLVECARFLLGHGGSPGILLPLRVAQLYHE